MQTQTVITRAGERRANTTRCGFKPQVRLTRAHLAIAARPSVIDEATRALDSIIAHLGEQLGTQLSAQARLRDATRGTLPQLAQHAMFASFELINDRIALVELDAALCHQLLLLAAGSADGPTVPLRLTRVEEAALCWLFLAALSAVGQTRFATRFAPKLVNLHLQRAEALGCLDASSMHLAIDISVQVSGRTGQARVLVPSLTVQSLIETEPIAAPAAAAAPSVLAARIEVICLAGHATLTADQFDALSVGDVVLFHDLRASPCGGAVGPGRVCSRTFELEGHFGPDTFNLTHAHRLELPTMMPPDPNAPVDLEIELTRLRLPLHQLGLLQAGTVVPLHINAAQAVTLRIGDKAVARAELVDIEGEIGARILTLL